MLYQLSYTPTPQAPIKGTWPPNNEQRAGKR
jgi:hypothetical protein